MDIPRPTAFPTYQQFSPDSLQALILDTLPMCIKFKGFFDYLTFKNLTFATRYRF